MWTVNSMKLNDYFKRSTTSNVVEGLNYLYKDSHCDYCGVGNFKLKPCYKELFKINPLTLKLLDSNDPQQILERIKETENKTDKDMTRAPRPKPLSAMALSKVLFSDEDARWTRGTDT
ncbi:unnamed protein product [Didymodactylos carnosus]|uniref:Uncharacterized protein n=1 Tax=Didymodactylos carnosus TaxID=1234261 RepID=A0A815YG69_9BILA|nr:unnamed protein product [Didymodactylos carnosus]CAF4433720.1 unnamed protein product [Didymodactylos carnosus]